MNYIKKINCIRKMSLKQIGLIAAIVVLLIISAFHHCGDKTMVVDFQRLWKEVKVYQQVSENYVAYQQGLKIKFNENIIDLQKQNQDLMAQKKKLSDAEFKKKMAALQQKATTLRQEYTNLSQKGTAGLEDALAGVKPQIDKVIQKVAKKAGAGVLLNKAMTLYADDAQDITDKIIKAINKEVPEIKLSAEDKKEKEK